MEPIVDIVIPIHNAVDYVQRMWGSLLHYTDPGAYRLILVDDASNPETKAFIHSMYEEFADDQGQQNITLLTNQYQQWFTRTSNRGIRHSSLPYVALLNTDIEFFEPWLEKFIGYFEDEKVMLVGSDFKWKDYSMPYDYPIPGDYVTGHCLVFRRKIFEELGVLTEENMHINSDRIFNYSIVEAGYKVVRDFTTRIEHGEGPSWERHISGGHALTLLAQADKSKLTPINNTIVPMHEDLY